MEKYLRTAQDLLRDRPGRIRSGCWLHCPAAQVRTFSPTCEPRTRHTAPSPPPKRIKATPFCPRDHNCIRGGQLHFELLAPKARFRVPSEFSARHDSTRLLQRVTCNSFLSTHHASRTTGPRNLTRNPYPPSAPRAAIQIAILVQGTSHGVRGDLGDLQAEILDLTHAIRNAGQAECRNVAGAQ